MPQKKILIYGAGVIGSIYAGHLSLAGYDVTLLARNARLKELEMHGLRIKNNKEAAEKVIKIRTVSELKPDAIYDFIFVTLHQEQVKNILPALRENKSATVVFMVNTCEGYAEWTAALGAHKVLPAFPGAGGKLEQGLLQYQITSKAVQPTTIGEVNGVNSPRLAALAEILEKSGFPVEICSNMDAWQKTHVAMMCPLVNVIFYDGGDNYSASQNPKALQQMVLALKEAFHFIQQSGIGIVPSKLSFLAWCPSWILKLLLKKAYNTKWAETVISKPALAAPHDYEMLTASFIKMAVAKGFELPAFKKLGSGPMKKQD